MIAGPARALGVPESPRQSNYRTCSSHVSDLMGALNVLYMFFSMLYWEDCLQVRSVMMISADALFLTL